MRSTSCAALRCVPFWSVSARWSALSPRSCRPLRNVYAHVFLQDRTQDDLRDSPEVIECARAEWGQVVCQGGVLALALAVPPRPVLWGYIVPVSIAGLLAARRLLIEHAYERVTDRRIETIIRTTNDNHLGALGARFSRRATSATTSSTTSIPRSGSARCRGCASGTSECILGSIRRRGSDQAGNRRPKRSPPSQRAGRPWQVPSLRPLQSIGLTPSHRVSARARAHRAGSRAASAGRAGKPHPDSPPCSCSRRTLRAAHRRAAAAGSCRGRSGSRPNRVARPSLSLSTTRSLNEKAGSSGQRDPVVAIDSLPIASRTDG